MNIGAKSKPLGEVQATNSRRLKQAETKDVGLVD